MIPGFAFHNGDEFGPRTLARIAKTYSRRAGLKSTDPVSRRARRTSDAAQAADPHRDRRRSLRKAGTPWHLATLGKAAGIRGVGRCRSVEAAHRQHIAGPDTAAPGAPDHLFFQRHRIVHADRGMLSAARVAAHRRRPVGTPRKGRPVGTPCRNLPVGVPQRKRPVAAPHAHRPAEPSVRATAISPAVW
jgi:hypothetical protein